MRYSLETAVTELLHHLGPSHSAAADIAFAYDVVTAGLRAGASVGIGVRALRFLVRTINDEFGHPDSVYDWAAEVALATWALDDRTEAGR